MLAVLISMAAHAAGPWVPGTERGSLYLGVTGQQFSRLARDGAAGRDVVRVGEGVASLTMMALVRYGLSPRVAAELSVPFHHGHVARSDAQVCTDLGPDACTTTNTVGNIEGRLKGLILDELSGQPVSLSVAAELRFGALHAPVRDRLTGPGIGSMDIGPVVSVGRSGALASGYFAGSFDLGWRYRFPKTTSFPGPDGPITVPGSEFHSVLELILAPIQQFGVGPSFDAFVRPFGVDFQETDMTDIDRFTALRVADVRAGVKVLIKDVRHNAFVLSASRTVFAWNNPVDTFSLGVGVNIVDIGSKGDD